MPSASPNARTAGIVVASLGIALAVVAAYALGRRHAHTHDVGTVVATLACYTGPSPNAACMKVHADHGIAFSSFRSCGRTTIGVVDSSTGVVEVELPPDTYQVTVVLRDQRLVPAKPDRRVTVRAGETIDLGRVEPSTTAVPYPMICD